MNDVLKYKQLFQYQPAITVQRHPRPVPHASSIDSIFSSPTKPSPLISNLSPPYTTEPRTPSHFSAPSIQMEPLRGNSHNHEHGFSGVTPAKGDTTVQKTEVSLYWWRYIVDWFKLDKKNHKMFLVCAHPIDSTFRSLSVDFSSQCFQFHKNYISPS